MDVDIAVKWDVNYLARKGCNGQWADHRSFGSRSHRKDFEGGKVVDPREILKRGCGEWVIYGAVLREGTKAVCCSQAQAVALSTTC